MAVEFVLFDVSEELVYYWKRFFDALVPQQVRERITIVHSGLRELKEHEELKELNGTFDCIVSPANSFGVFDGGFDQTLSEALAPADNPSALTGIAQKVLYAEWRGYAPPGTCTLIPLSDTPCADNKYRCRYVALCPTMRMPSPVDWHKEIVYNAVWSLLVAVDLHNARATKEPEVISSVVMTGLATGIGCVPVEKCARQTALAFAHYHDAIVNSTMWSSLSWNDIERFSLNERLPIDD